eukprot:431054_1
MGDNVKRIEGWAFYGCSALRFIRLSKTLEYIGEGAFWECDSLEALFLPSTVKEIGHRAFDCCGSLRLLILPNISNVGNAIIQGSNIQQIASVAYEYENNYDGYGDIITEDSNLQVNEWLIYYMDEW